MGKEVCRGGSPWNGPEEVIKGAMRLLELRETGQGDSQEAQELECLIDIRGSANKKPKTP